MRVACYRSHAVSAQPQSPQPDRTVRRSRVADALRGRLPAQAVLTEREDLRPYECDGLSAYRETPLVTALPATISEAADIMRVARETGTPVVARGSGTGLSGGATPLA